MTRLSDARIAEIEAICRRRFDSLDRQATRNLFIHHRKAIRDLLEDRKALVADRDHARDKVAQAYQVLGALFVGEITARDDEQVRALDYFSDSDGPSDDDFLPWPRLLPEPPNG